jgi:hypothetical protein
MGDVIAFPSAKPDGSSPTDALSDFVLRLAASHLNDEPLDEFTESGESPEPIDSSGSSNGRRSRQKVDNNDRSHSQSRPRRFPPRCGSPRNGRMSTHTITSDEVAVLIGNYLLCLGRSRYAPSAPHLILSEMFETELLALHDVHAAGEDPDDQNRHRYLGFAMGWGIKLGISAAIPALNETPPLALEAISRTILDVRAEANDRVGLSYSYFTDLAKRTKRGPKKN